MSITIKEYNARPESIGSFTLTEKDILQNGDVNNSGTIPVGFRRNRKLKCCAYGWLGVFSTDMPEGSHELLEGMLPVSKNEYLTDWNDGVACTRRERKRRRGLVADAINELAMENTDGS